MYADGRGLEYDEVTGAFSSGGVPVPAEDLAVLEQQGAVTWVSPDVATWFRSNFMAAAVAPRTRPVWLRQKWWVYVLGVLMLCGMANALTGGGASDTPSTKPVTKPAQSTPAPAPVVPKTLELSAAAPTQVEAPSVEVKGQTIPGASVTIQGSACAVDAAGAFVATIPLVEGANAIVVKAVMTGYQDAATTVSVTRTVPAPVAQTPPESTTPPVGSSTGSGSGSGSGSSVTPPPPSGDNTTAMVYITPTGEKYHSAGCRYLKGSTTTVSLAEAQSRGLTPCSVCSP